MRAVGAREGDGEKRGTRAVMQTPAHCRGPTLKPKTRSARTARKTSPAEMTAWTSDRGASAIAATWNSQAPIATPMPMANHLEVQRLRCTPKGVLPLHVRGSAGATVLEQEGQVREKSAQEREQYADLNGHECNERRGALQTCDGPAVAIRAIGAGASPFKRDQPYWTHAP